MFEDQGGRQEDLLSIEVHRNKLSLGSWTTAQLTAVGSAVLFAESHLVSLMNNCFELGIVVEPFARDVLPVLETV